MFDAGHDDVSAKYRLEQTIDTYFERYAAAAAAIRAREKPAHAPAHSA